MTDELFEQRSIGASTQFTVALANDGVGDLWSFATPAIRLGLAYEHIEVFEDGVILGVLGNRYGAELSVLDMMYLRYGRVDGDWLGNDNEGTFGGGFQLKYRNMIGVKGDYAAYPRGDFLNFNYDRWGLTFFVDPYRLMKKGAEEGEKGAD